MRREFVVYLHEIFNAGDAIQRFIGGIDRETFAALEEKQAAVERKFKSWAKQSPNAGFTIRQKRSLGDVQGVVDFRNYIAHRYHLVKSELVWDIVENDLPPCSNESEA